METTTEATLEFTIEMPNGFTYDLTDHISGWDDAETNRAWAEASIVQFMHSSIDVTSAKYNGVEFTDEELAALRSRTQIHEP